MTSHGGKGRPTPKRSEARKRRRPVSPTPGNRKEAARHRRAEHAKNRNTMRRALMDGDERYYPPAHAGPERAAVRDAVDARKGIGWLVLPGYAVMFVLSLVPVAAVQLLSLLGFFGIVVLIVMDSFAAARAIRQALAERFPAGTTERRGRLVRYGLARNAMVRRWRLPRPRVSG